MTSPLIAAPSSPSSSPAASAPTLLDVRWELATGAQRDRYESGHIPGAAFIDLGRELSAPPGPGGRHPLPAPEAFAPRCAPPAYPTTAGRRLRRGHLAGGRPRVVAAALPWPRRRAVLDGGLAAWTAAGGAVATGAEPAPEPGDFSARPGAMATLDAASAAALTGTGVLLDARAPERFRGDVEPMDPVGGHIPGARNLPMARLLQDGGRLRDPEAVRGEFEAAGVDGTAAVGAYCGSGITAAHTVLALELAGLDGALYPGSWSEWVTDPARPVATGA